MRRAIITGLAMAFGLVLGACGGGSGDGAEAALEDVAAELNALAVAVAADAPSPLPREAFDAAYDLGALDALDEDAARAVEHAYMATADLASGRRAVARAGEGESLGAFMARDELRRRRQVAEIAVSQAQAALDASGS